MNSFFNDVITKLVVEKSKQCAKFDLASIAADRVGCDNHWVNHQLVNFLKGKACHVGLVDTYDKAKSARYQYFGASSATWMGKYIVDPDLLHLACVSIFLLCIKEFASDLLVLKLTLYETVDKLCRLVDKDPGCFGLISTILFFIWARLCLVNSKSLGYHDRIVLM